MKETGLPGENYRPVASDWQTLSHVVLSTHRLSWIGTHSFIGDIGTDCIGSYKSNYDDDHDDHLTWRGRGVWFFVSFRNLFSNNTRVRIFFFCRAKRENFFQNLTLDYMTKTLNQIIFFFLHQNRNIFFSNIGNQNIFLEKNHNPPFKLNGRSLRCKKITIDVKWWQNLTHNFSQVR